MSHLLTSAELTSWVCWIADEGVRPQYLLSCLQVHHLSLSHYTLIPSLLSCLQSFQSLQFAHPPSSTPFSHILNAINITAWKANPLYHNGRRLHRQCEWNGLSTDSTEGDTMSSPGQWWWGQSSAITDSNGQRPQLIQIV